MTATSSAVGLAVKSCWFHVTIEVNSNWISWIFRYFLATVSIRVLSSLLDSQNAVMLPHSVSVWDIVTNVVLWRPAYQTPSYKPNFALLSSVSAELDYSRILFILELAYTAGSARQVMTCSNKPILAQTMLAKRSYAHVMACGILNTMLLHFWRYLRYWWNEMRFSVYVGKMCQI